MAIRRLLLIPCSLLLLGLLSACGESESSGGATTPVTAQEATEPEGGGSDCEAASTVLVEALNSSLTIAGGGTVTNVNVMEVTDPPPAPFRGYADGVYAVAAKFVGEGMDNTYGIWAASRDMVRTGGGLIIGADSVTREFSEFGAAARSGSPAAEYAGEIKSSDAGDQALDCAKD